MTKQLSKYNRQELGIDLESKLKIDLLILDLSMIKDKIERMQLLIESLRN